jgi:MFS superfamily sulfate permease-like transporter
MNAIALTVLIGQLPKLFGFSVKADDLPEKTLKLFQGIADGRTNAWPCSSVPAPSRSSCCSRPIAPNGPAS